MHGVRESLDDILDILIFNNQGQPVRIREVATIDETMQPPTIERKDRTPGNGYMRSSQGSSPKYPGGRCQSTN